MMSRAPLSSVVGGYRLPMSGHEHENNHALEDEERRPNNAGGNDMDSDQDSDQDSEPTLNAPGDAAPSGVVPDDPEEEQS